MCVRSIRAVFALIAVCSCYSASAQSASSKINLQPYSWKNVQIVGGGFVDGVIFHPKEKGLRYARTTLAYRWNDQSKHWEPLLDWVSPVTRSNMAGSTWAPTGGELSTAIQRVADVMAVPNKQKNLAATYGKLPGCRYSRDPNAALKGLL